MSTKTKWYTLRNSFHSTQITIRSEPDDVGRIPISKGQIARVRKALCPVKDCPCAMNALGQRGAQLFELSPDSPALIPSKGGLREICLKVEQEGDWPGRRAQLGSIWLGPAQGDWWVAYLQDVEGASAWIARAPTFLGAANHGLRKLESLVLES